jgi:hypothetical protein
LVDCVEESTPATRSMTVIVVAPAADDDPWNAPA